MSAADVVKKREILDYVRLFPGKTSRQISESAGLPYRSTCRILSRLEMEGKIEKNGYVMNSERTCTVVVWRATQ